MKNRSVKTIAVMIVLAGSLAAQTLSGGASLSGAASVGVVSSSSYPGIPTGTGWHLLGVKDASGYSTSLAYSIIPASAVTDAATALSDSGTAVPYGVCPKASFSDGSYTSTYNFRSKCGGVIIAQSGGAADTRRNKLYLHGGGHSDYAGNETYVLDLNVNPVTLKRASNPTVPTTKDDPNYSVSSSCVDGLPQVRTGTPWTTCVPSDTNGNGCWPSPVHSASSGIFYKNPTDSTQDLFVRIGGSIDCGPGNSSTAVWSTLLNSGFTNTWRWMDKVATSTEWPIWSLTGAKIGTFEDYCDVDTLSNLVICVDSDRSMFTYDPPNNVWKRVIANASYEANQNSVVAWHNSTGTESQFFAMGNCSGSPISGIARSSGTVTVTTSYTTMFIGSNAVVGTTPVWVYGTTDASFETTGTTPPTLGSLSGNQLTYTTSDMTTASSSGGWVMSCNYNASGAATMWGFTATNILTPNTPGAWENWNNKTLDASNTDTGNAALGNTCAEFARGGVDPLNGVEGARFSGGKSPGLAFYPTNNTIIGWPNEGTSLYEITPDVTNKIMKCRRIDLAGNTTETGTLTDTVPTRSISNRGVSNSTWGTYRGHFDYWPGPNIFTVIQSADRPVLAVRLP